MPHGLLFEVGPDNAVRQYVIEQDEVLIGRGADCDIRLHDSTVSRHHALLTTRAGCRLADLGGPNPTRVNGEALDRVPRRLADGDVIGVGACSLRFAAAAMPADAPTPASAEIATAILDEAPALTVFNAPVDQLRLAASDATVSVVLGRDNSPALLVHDGERTQAYPLEGLPWTIGRTPQCHILLTDVRSSREHARLEATDRGLLLRDLGSANRTYVNGAPVAERLLRPDDTIRIGHTSIVLRGARLPEQTAAPQAAGDHAPVVIIPGLCGTELYKGEQRLWPNPLHLISCSDEELADCWGEATPGRAVRYTFAIPGIVKVEAFGRLVDFLCQELGYSDGVDLLEFGYDWRQDIRQNARLLKARVDEWRATLADPHAKIVFIAHSMGGLVCRYYLEHLGGQDLCARLIQLGTPNAGSTRIVSTLISGRNAIVLPIGSSRIQRVMTHFPAVYQLLPSYNAIRLPGGDWFDPLADADWLPADTAAHLQIAVELRRALANRPRGLPTTCVFGYGQRTLAALDVTRAGDGRLTVAREIFDDIGDDSVCESSAILDGAEIHPVMQRHGALYADKDVHRRLRYELLERPR